MTDNTSTLKNLGSAETNYKYDKPSVDILEIFENQYPQRDYIVEYIFNEFTSLCLCSDMRIDVATNETLYPEGRPIKDLVGTSGHVFSFDREKNTPVARRYHSVRKTQENVPVVRVSFTLLKGASNARTPVEKSIVCTPTHPFLVRTGWGKFAWVAASELKKDMQLVADQRNADLIRGKARHRLILEDIEGRELESNEIGHHIDYNHFNNTPDNLCVEFKSEHISLHQTARYAINLDIQKLVQEYEDGANFHSLAQKYAVDVSTIYSRIAHLVERREQRDSLRLTNNSVLLDQQKAECRALYDRGYTTGELAHFYDRHSTTISSWIQDAGGLLRTSLETKKMEERGELPSLNHRVVGVVDAGVSDVYNMEVEDTECFFAEGVVVHNCPKTGQPDFAAITIRYTPNKYCIETKSLKLYFLMYRQYGSFMETIVNKILDDCVHICQPRYMEIIGKFNARGGTLINVTASYTR